MYKFWDLALINIALRQHVYIKAPLLRDSNMHVTSVLLVSFKLHDRPQTLYQEKQTEGLAHLQEGNN